jgi:voltage-gated potassium channel
MVGMRAKPWIVQAERGLRWLWPQAPLALFLIAAGALNVLAGLHSDMLAHWFGNGATTGITTLSGQGSLLALGSGVQVILGAGMVLSGLGLFWKLRVAWIFALGLLGIAIAVNVGKMHFGGSMIIPCIAFVLLAVAGRYFDRSTAAGATLISGVGFLAVLAYGTFGIYLLGDQFDPHITSPLTALYFTVETLSTTGYGDYHPTTLFAQAYMITLWVVGLSVFATALFSVLGPALAGHFDRLFNPRRGRSMPKNHIIIVGAGAMARNTAEELARRSVDFVQVIGNGMEPAVPDRPFVTGEVSADHVLEEAGIAHARMLIAAAEADDENAFVVLAAKDLNPKLQVIAVATNVQAIRRLKLAHADMAFAPADVGSRLLAGVVEGEALPPAFRELFDANPT